MAATDKENMGENPEVAATEDDRKPADMDSNGSDTATLSQTTDPTTPVKDASVEDPTETADAVTPAKNTGASAVVTPLTEGKRKRTTVQAFVPVFPVAEKKELEFGVGSGELLGDVTIVTDMMGKTTSEHYIPLHKLLYGRNGENSKRKANIRRFNGFHFPEDSKLYDNKLGQIKKLKASVRYNICKLLGLKQTSKHDELLGYLLTPHDSGKRLPKRKTKSKTPSKRRSAPARTSSKPKTPSKSSRKASKSDQRDGSDLSHAESESGSAEEEEEKESPKQAPKRRKVSKPKISKKVSKSDQQDGSDLSLTVSESGSGEEEASPKQAQKRRKVSSSEKARKVPSDSELRKSIEKVVESIDLEKVSMKQAVAQVIELYPDVDMSEKKTFIKDAIRKSVE